MRNKESMFGTASLNTYIYEKNIKIECLLTF